MTFMEHVMKPVHAAWPQTPPLRLMRYALSGALVGVATVGVASWLWNVPQRDSYDLIGAGIGFAIVVLVKALRLA